MDREIHGIMQIAALGEDAKEFLTGELGKGLEIRAQTEIDNLIEELITQKPATFLQRLMGNDPLKDIQDNIKIRQYALTWIADIIEEGAEAMNQLDSLDEEIS